MHATRKFFVVLGTALAGAALAAEPPSEIDAHISAAKSAAGLDYRATFVNLCFTGANPALAARGAGPARGAAPAAGGGGAAAGGRGAGAGAAATPDRANWYASPYKIFDNFYWLGTRQHS